MPDATYFGKKPEKKKNAARGRRMKVQSICGKCSSFVKNAVGRKTAKTGEKDNLFRKNVTYLKKKQHRFEKAQHMRNKCNMFLKLQKNCKSQGDRLTSRANIFRKNTTYLKKKQKVCGKMQRIWKKCDIFVKQ